ncbi:single-stranded DNA-binding protein [Dactylosporangium salmoneum]|uniref:Single-stranded DNA-binding protein n=1 Tax=Dactylosporangium salmoneum TaxID=53361 RepID=A0ABN3G8T8_9ACTN
MSLPTLSGVGRLIDAPELRFIPSGKAMCKVRLAFNSRRKNPQTDQWEDADVYYVDGTVWGQEAEAVAESLDKGHEVFVSGRLKTRKYETREGEKRSVTELDIDAIGPTLKYATVKVTKMQRSGGQSTGGTGFGGGGDDPWANSAPAGGSKPSSFGDEPPF